MNRDNEKTTKSKAKGIAPRKVFAFGYSPVLIEIILMNAPKYAIGGEIFSPLVSTPHDADILLVLGPVSFKMAPILKRVYEQMAPPKMVVALGTRPLFESSNLVDSIGDIIPVDRYFANIQPSPLEIRELVDLIVPRSSK